MKIGRGCLQVVVVYERFQLEGFDCENFGVLDALVVAYGRWSLITGERMGSSIVLNVKFWFIYSHFWKRYRQMDLFRPKVFFRPKAISKVAIIKTKSATITFFPSPPFFVFALSFSPFLFLRYSDFGASRA